MARKDLISLAIEHGAKPNAVDANGWTALMRASAQGNASAIKALLAGGADPNITNKQGFTALDIAMANGNDESAQALRTVNAKFDSSRQPTGGDLLIDLWPGQLYPELYSELERASIHGKLNDVKRLVANTSDAQRARALAEAVEANNTEVIRAILQSGSIDNNTLSKGIEKAIRWGNADAVSMLIGASTTWNADQMAQLESDAEYAAHSNQLALLKTFLQSGIQPEPAVVTSNPDVLAEESILYVSPLARTAEQGSDEALRVLLQNGFTPKGDPNALLMAILYGNDEAAKILLQAGADPNVTFKTLLSGDSMTPLMYAVKSSDADLVQALIDAGADVNARTVDGFTALKFALPRSNQAVIERLQQAGAAQ